MPLIGGETAEMPGIYKQKDYDLAGFCVGIIDKKNIINKNEINKGDIIIGLMSNGMHSNGYSLINKLLDNKTLSLKKNYFGVNLGRLLIKPTLLYVDALNKIKKTISIKGVAHITGGGITENLPRVIPKKYTISINLDNWKMPNIFKLIKESAKLSMDEMLRTFNCGIGMAIIVKKSDASKVIKILEKTKFKAKIIGQINKKHSNKIIKYEKG
jgi:phosphoribosylformylglycinamidine cyclo-ligase